MEGTFGSSKPVSAVDGGPVAPNPRVSRARRSVPLALVCLLIASPALAQDGPPAAPSEADVARAKELFDNGQILYDEGNYEQAITAWEQSYKLSGYPDLLYNISGAYERLGNYKQALAVLDQYRVYATPDERATLDRRIAAMEERLAAQAAATPSVTPPETPPPTTLPPPEPPPAVTPPAARRSPLPVALLGVGGVGIGIGAVEGFRALGARGAIADSCFDTGNGYLCERSSAPDVDRHAHAAMVSAVSLGAGAAFAALGVVAFALGGSSDDVQLVPMPGGGSLVLNGRF